MENVAGTLNNIVKTGHYTFRLNQEASQWQMFLEYTLSSEIVTGTKAQHETWNSEQIGDFVQKLGFLDKDKENITEGLIATFLQFNQVCYSTEVSLCII